MIVVFSLLFLLLASHILYPVLIMIFGYAKGRRESNAQNEMEFIASCKLSILIGAYNEQNTIEERIKNLLDSPLEERICDLLILSDGSTDETNAIAAKYQKLDSRVRLVNFDERRGKNACLNDGMKLISGDLVLFTDANSRYEPEAFAELMRHFSDSSVGCVGGEELHAGSKKAITADTAYMSFEAILKEAESNLGIFFSCNGSIMMVRRSLVRPLPLDVPNDMHTPLDVLAQGSRVVYAPKALCFETGVQKADEIYARKRRIVGRAARCAVSNFSAVPYKTKFAIVFHKILRWATLPVVVIAMLVLLIIGVTGNSAALYFGLLMLSVGLLVLFCSLLEIRGIYSSVPIIRKISHVFGYTGLIFSASTMALWDQLRGRRYVTWTQAASTRR